MKLGIYDSSNMLNLMITLTLSLYDQFEYTEFGGDVHFFCFELKIPFQAKLGQKK